MLAGSVAAGHGCTRPLATIASTSVSRVLQTRSPTFMTMSRGTMTTGSADQNTLPGDAAAPSGVSWPASSTTERSQVT